MTIPRELSFLGGQAAIQPKERTSGHGKAADMEVRFPEPTGIETVPTSQSETDLADLPSGRENSVNRSVERQAEGEADHTLARPASPTFSTGRTRSNRLFQYQIQGTDAALRSLRGSQVQEPQVDEKR